MLWDNLEEWDGVLRGREIQEGAREGIDVPLWLIHTVVWQKPTQHCKAIILQLKKIVLNENSFPPRNFHWAPNGLSRKIQSLFLIRALQIVDSMCPLPPLP